MFSASPSKPSLQRWADSYSCREARLGRAQKIAIPKGKRNMSSDQIPSEGTPESSVDARLGALDDASLDLLAGQQSAHDPFNNAFDNS
jgi:hypothetical protein